MVEGGVALINFSITQQNISQQSKLLGLKAGHWVPSKTGMSVLVIAEAPSLKVLEIFFLLLSGYN